MLQKHHLLLFWRGGELQITNRTVFILAIGLLWLFQIIVRVKFSIYAAEVNNLSGDQSGYRILCDIFSVWWRIGNCERLPLYPFFLFVVSRVCRFLLLSDLFILLVFLIQHFIVLISMHLMSTLAYKIKGNLKYYAVVFGVMSFYYPFILHPNGFLTESLYMFTMVISVYSMCASIFEFSSGISKKAYVYYLSSAFFLALTALVRPNIALFLVVLCPVLFAINRTSFKLYPLYLIVFMAVLTPWFLRNYSIYGKVCYSSVVGENLYQSNHMSPRADYGMNLLIMAQRKKDDKNLENLGIGRMENTIKSFMNRKDVERDMQYYAQGMYDIMWFSNYDFADYYWKKIKGVAFEYFKAGSLEYSYSGILPQNLPLPNVFNSLYHIVLVVLSFFYLVKKCFRVQGVEFVFLSLLIYEAFISLFAPSFPRIHLPYLPFLFYFSAMGFIELFTFYRQQWNKQLLNA